MVSPAIPVILLGQRSPLQQFLDAMFNVSSGNLRALWLPGSADTTTTTARSNDRRVYTYDATIAARISAQGSGIVVSFSAVGQYGTTPDTANLSFGDSLVDSPMSIVALANVTDTAAVRTIFSKDNGTTNREYSLNVDATDKLNFYVADQSVTKFASVLSNAAITQAALHQFGVTYDGRGGATAATGMTLYQDAAVIASTATNDALYVAMENLTAQGGLGYFGIGTLLFQGSLGFVAIYGAALSTAQHVAIKTAVNTYYGLAL